MANASKQVLESVPAHEKMLHDCEALLLDLNPEKKKDAEHLQELNKMRDELAELKQLLLSIRGNHSKEE